jgi:hypothetical protein
MPITSLRKATTCRESYQLFLQHKIFGSEHAND